MLIHAVINLLLIFSVHEICRTRLTCPMNFQNVRRRAAVKFNQMSGKNLQMSSEAQTVFTYTEFCFKLTLELNFSAFTDHIFKSV